MNDMTRPTSAPANFPAMLKQFLPEIQRALPKHMDGDRMARIALTAFRSTPNLAKCDPVSVFAAVIQSSQLGLEVGLMGEAHLVPFKDKCQLIPGYQGLMKLARNSGLISDIYAHEVRAEDRFEMAFGLDRQMIHEPLMDSGFPASDERRGDIVGFYAVAVFKDGTRAFAAMSRHDVEKIRDNSKGYKASKQYGKESLWDTDFLSMGLKTAIRRLCKYLPKSPELAAALALDSLAERGKEQKIELKDAIEGSWAPTDDDSSASEQPDTAVERPQRKEKPAQAAQEGTTETGGQAAEPTDKKPPGMDKVLDTQQWKVLRAKMKNAALTDMDLEAKFGPVDTIKGSEFAAITEWIASRSKG